MSYLKLIPESTIREVEESQTTNPGLQEHNKKQKQEEFLAVFERCLSVKVSCERVGISPHGYRYWKKTDAEFLRKLNHILEDWQTELVSASLTKAIGYVRKNDDGEIETDGFGSVIRYGSEPSLAKYFMDAMGVGADTKTGEGAVNVIIDVGNLLGQEYASKQRVKVDDSLGSLLRSKSTEVLVLPVQPPSEDDDPDSAA